jgi:hypothetical protein
MKTRTPLTQQQLETLTHSRQATLNALVQLDEASILSLSQLTLPEIRSIQQEVARILPAGNLPAMLLSGLLKLKGRRLTAARVRRDLATLFKGVELLPQSLYGFFVAGPSAVLYGYQKLLELAGKDLESAFPQGTWQFYVEFGLREDTARHTNETLGFHRALPAAPDPVDTAVAWVCACQRLIVDYDALLATDWRERVMLRVLGEALIKANDDPSLGRSLIRGWLRRLPYHRPHSGESYLAHRRARFRAFLEAHLAELREEVRTQIRERYATRERQALPAYQEQMTLLAALTPETYQERKDPIAPWRVTVAFVWKGRTYPIPVYARDAQGSPLGHPEPDGSSPAEPFPLYTDTSGGLCDAHGRAVTVRRDGTIWDVAGEHLGKLRPLAPTRVRQIVGAILNATPTDPVPTLDIRLAESPRARQPQLRAQLPEVTRHALSLLRRAPIVINWDLHAHNAPLAILRRGHRGIGDHALTVIRTDASMVFDQSHIFFDGMWGMAVSEILTDSAIHWYRTLADSTPVPPSSESAPQTDEAPVPLALQITPEIEALSWPTHRRREAVAESDGVNLEALQRLRRWLRARGASMTVNDLLLLYRSFHAARYRLSPSADDAVKAFRRNHGDTPEGRAALETLERALAHDRRTNPALLIPMDAGHVSPRERLYPTTYRNPLTDLLPCFEQTWGTYQAYRQEANATTWTTFDRSRRELFAYLKAFGEVLDAIKAVTMRGESFNTATIKLLGHLPSSMQHLLDQIPQRIGVLNEIIKGSEVFSNVGRVAKASTLHRFISAKDDGETKWLVWGVMTDAAGTMHVSLRDFRPYVGSLIALGETELADRLAQDYLNRYVKGLNRFVAELSTMVAVTAPDA